MLCISLNLLVVEIELDANTVIGWVTKEFNNNLQMCRHLSKKVLDSSQDYVF